jgi:hypothetical protein
MWWVSRPGHTAERPPVRLGASRALLGHTPTPLGRTWSWAGWSRPSYTATQTSRARDRPSDRNTHYSSGLVRSPRNRPLQPLPLTVRRAAPAVILCGTKIQATL